MQQNGFIPDYNETAIRAEQRHAISQSTAVWGFTIAITEILISFIAERIFVAAAFFGIDLSLPAPALIFQLFLSVFIMTVPFIIAARSSGNPVAKSIKFKAVPPSLFLPLIMVALGAISVANNLTNTFTSFLQLFNFNPASGQFALPEGDLGGLLLIVVVSVAPAIFEEFAYRGIVLGALRKYGNSFAIIASSLLFGLMHGNFEQIPFAFLLGCVLAYINVITDSIWPSVTVHFLNNLLSCIQQIVIAKCSETVSVIFLAASLIFYFTLGVVGFVLICRKHEHPFSPLHEECPISLDVSLPGFLLSPGTVAAYIIFGGIAIVKMLPYPAGI